MNTKDIEQWAQENINRILKESAMKDIAGRRAALLNRAIEAQKAMKYKSLADMRKFLKH